MQLDLSVKVTSIGVIAVLLVIPLFLHFSKSIKEEENKDYIEVVNQLTIEALEKPGLKKLFHVLGETKGMIGSSATSFSVYRNGANRVQCKLILLSKSSDSLKTNPLALSTLTRNVTWKFTLR